MICFVFTEKINGLNLYLNKCIEKNILELITQKLILIFSHSIVNDKTKYY